MHTFYTLENKFIKNLTHDYKEEIDILLNIANLYGNRIQPDIFIKSISLIEDDITLDIFLIGYCSEKNITVSNDIIKLIDSLKIAIHIEGINRLDLHTVIKFNLKNIKDNKEILQAIKTYIQLLNLYIEMVL